MRGRGGFTLVETLVALVLFAFAMLALVAASALVVRDLGAARREQRAAEAARIRIEQLAAAPCPVVASGTRDRDGGLTEHWKVEGQDGRRVITDSVVFARAAGRAGHALVSAVVLCTS